MPTLYNSFALGCHGTMVYPLPYVCEALDTTGLNLVGATSREQTAVTEKISLLDKPICCSALKHILQHAFWLPIPFPLDFLLHFNNSFIILSLINQETFPLHCTEPLSRGFINNNNDHAKDAIQLTV